MYIRKFVIYSFIEDLSKYLAIKPLILIKITQENKNLIRHLEMTANIDETFKWNA